VKEYNKLNLVIERDLKSRRINCVGVM